MAAYPAAAMLRPWRRGDVPTCRRGDVATWRRAAIAVLWLSGAHTAVCAPASSRQRRSRRSSASRSGSIFFSGWRSRPGTMAATSQLERPMSTTATMVASCSKGIRDLLRSFGYGIGGLRRLVPAAMVLRPRRRPIASQPDRAGLRQAQGAAAVRGRPHRRGLVGGRRTPARALPASRVRPLPRPLRLQTVRVTSL